VDGSSRSARCLVLRIYRCVALLVPFWRLRTHGLDLSASSCALYLAVFISRRPAANAMLLDRIIAWFAHNAHARLRVCASLPLRHHVHLFAPALHLHHHRMNEGGR